MTEDFQLMERCKATPAGADFSIVIDTAAMEPLIRRGQQVFVSCRAELSEMDTGLFLYEGQVYCRRWCEDYNGALVLLGGDPSRQQDCLYLDRDQRRRCLCLGKVLI